jgi:hypothetical protein
VAVVTGLVLYKPVQPSVLAWLLGGLRMVRIWHFAAMLGLVSFVPGHMIMVALHGWNDFRSMLIGWKKDPELVSMGGFRNGPTQIELGVKEIATRPRQITVA